MNLNLNSATGYAILREMENALKRRIEVISIEWNIEDGFIVKLKDGEFKLRLHEIHS